MRAAVPAVVIMLVAAWFFWPAQTATLPVTAGTIVYDPPTFFIGMRSLYPRPTRVAVVCDHHGNCSDLWSLGDRSSRDSVFDGSACGLTGTPCEIKCMVNQAEPTDQLCPPAHGISDKENPAHR